jgi:hypothetical protein
MSYDPINTVYQGLIEGHFHSVDFLIAENHIDADSLFKAIDELGAQTPLHAALEAYRDEKNLETVVGWVMSPAANTSHLVQVFNTASELIRIKESIEEKLEDWAKPFLGGNLGSIFAQKVKREDINNLAQELDSLAARKKVDEAIVSIKGYMAKQSL